MKWCSLGLYIKATLFFLLRQNNSHDWHTDPTKHTHMNAISTPMNCELPLILSYKLLIYIQLVSRFKVCVVFLLVSNWDNLIKKI